MPVDLSVHMSSPMIEVVLSLLLGVSLSASCGFRVFIPPLILSVAALFLGVTLPNDMAWFATYPAFLIFLTATLLEVGAYYVPWLDNALDHVTTPAAVVAGTVITHSFIGVEMDPMLKWALALVAGGGASGAVQGVTALARSASSLFTMGLTNPALATVENTAAVAIPSLAIWFPLVAIFIVSSFLVMTVFILSKFKKKKAVSEEELLMESMSKTD